MKKLILIVLLFATYVGAWAQIDSLQLLNNYSNEEIVELFKNSYQLPGEREEILGKGKNKDTWVIFKFNLGSLNQIQEVTKDQKRQRTCLWRGLDEGISDEIEKYFKNAQVTLIIAEEFKKEITQLIKNSSTQNDEDGTHYIVGEIEKNSRKKNVVILYKGNELFISFGEGMNTITLLVNEKPQKSEYNLQINYEFAIKDWKLWSDLLVEMKKITFTD